ncbi:MAG: YceI family protein [Bacteroidetes bacterium]|nr:YceI family protein [Bacteroidota bacterium]
MKKTIALATIAMFGLTAFAGQPAKTQKSTEDTYKVSAEKSTFKWNAKKVTGEHSGEAKFSTGSIMVNGKNLVGGAFEVDMTSINATDLQGEYHDKLNGHLKSDDFFAVEKFKTATLKIKSVSTIKDAIVGSNNYNVVADLTIKGITKEVSFPAMVVITKEQVITNAEFDIDRTNYDIKYGSGKFFEGIGDKAIMDNFNVKVRLIATK